MSKDSWASRVRERIQVARAGRRWHAKLAMVTLLAALVGLYVALMLAAFLGQRRMMYPCPAELRVPEPASGRLVKLTGAERRTIHALYVPARSGQPTVVILHGNAEQLGDQVDLVQDFASAGLGSFALEYPGYGLSADYSTTESHVYADVETALVHLRDGLGVSNDKTVLYGRSLGTGVAAEMAARGYGARLILVSTYTSMLDVARLVMPFLPTRWLVLDRYDTLSKARRIPQPALLVHGAADDIIPSWMAERVAAALQHARLRIVPGAGHNDLLLLGGSSLGRTMADFAITGQL